MQTVILDVSTDKVVGLPLEEVSYIFWPIVKDEPHQNHHQNICQS